MSDERFRWALRILQIRQEDIVLEIGCGTGKAAGMVADHLSTGHLTAIDRSSIMIAKAKRLVSSKKVTFLVGQLGGLSLPYHHFSKAYAFNVSSFWTADAEKELDLLRAHLRRDGAFYLFHQPPTSIKTKAIAKQSKESLEAAGFRIEKEIFENIRPATVSCIISTPSDPKR